LPTFAAFEVPASAVKAMKSHLKVNSKQVVKMKIGFIGLGNMGKAMVNVLLQNYLDLVVYNRTRSAADELEQAGAKVANSPIEVVSVELS
jgi:glutamyl-tRNA reductase